MRKFTFDDWLNDRIDIKLPGGFNILEASNGLAELLGEEQISQEDYQLVKSYQERAFDLAVELTVNALIKIFEERYNRSKNKLAFCKNEILRNNQILDKDLNLKGAVLAGSKTYFTIKGSEYKKIMECKSSSHEGSLDAFAYNDNMRLTATYRYQNYLKGKRHKDEKSFPDYLNHINNLQLAEQIRGEFATERGKEIKVLINILEEMELLSRSPSVSLL